MSRLLLPHSVPGGERCQLSKAQLDRLAAVAAHALTHEQERRLSEICDNHVCWKRFEQEATGAGSATPVFIQVRKDLSNLVNTLTNIMGMDTPQHHHVHVHVNEQLENTYSEKTDPTHAVWEQLRQVQLAVDRSYRKHKRLFAGPGRSQTTEGIRMFIWALADLFEEAGGKASANFKGFKDRPDSPFLRWVTEINRCLPVEARGRPTALPYLVRSVCRSRARRRSKSM